ncbi:MAG: leucine-rich repeat protein [Clostridia bacterium]|nr:leucine-rich repeat protein [Clostridia bacterium]
MKRIVCLLLVLVLIFTLVACDGGKDGVDGADGKDGINGVDGVDGADGKDGEDGKDGADGKDGEDGKDGADGEDGKDGADGADGKTPYIGANGNWWIGDVDTGVLADYSADDRKISDGLIFVTATVGGKAGMVVTDYEGSDTAVVIPNYVGSVPVIGISEDAFYGNTRIESVSLSKNTVWMDKYVFRGCTKLTSIDFNGAKLTEIPAYAFYDTAIQKIVLPETVTKLGDYAFCGSGLIDINYENISYFGSHSLYNTPFTYVFLDKDVEYVGDYAFSDSFVFVEHETIPSTWKSNFYGSSSMFRPVTNARISADGNYVYSINDVANGTVAVNRYIGTATRIQVPKTIDGHTVTEIGHGFDSVSDDDFIQLSTTEAVIIPDTVKKIDCYAFYYSHSFIYVPSSVEIIEWNEENLFAFYAFESADFFTEEQKEDFLGDIRFALGIDYSKLVYDTENKIYLYEDFFGYSVLASVQVFAKEITIPATYNGKKIHTINSWSVYTLAEVRISDGVSKIQKEAIHTDSSVYIPKSVTTIHAYGVEADGYYLVEAKTKPDEWDTYWNNRDSSVIYDAKDWRIDSESEMIYTVVGDEATLVKYLGSNSTIRIPRQINGYTVAKIATGFYSCSNSRTIYIPKEVKTIASKAFTNTGYSYYYYCYFTFYVEAAEQPADWSDEWYYNSYYENSTECVEKNWGQTLSY